MRTLGPAEIIIILALVALVLGGTRIKNLLTWLGELARPKVAKFRWILKSLGGSEEEEIKAERPVGREIAKKVLSQFGEDPDAGARERLGQIGTKLAAAAGGKREFTFRLLRNGSVNAFAVPGGNVFVTRRLYDLLGRDDDQTAFILGHEMAHVILRHSAERYAVETVLRALGRGGLTISLLSKGYSEESEFEADRMGREIAVKAGFDGRQAGRALERIREAAGGEEPLEEYWSTHPPLEERVNRLSGG